MFPLHASNSPPAGSAIYPQLGQAILLTFAVVILQIIFSVPLTILSMIVGIPIVQHPAALALVNLAAFGVVLSWGVWKNAAPASTVLYWRPMRLGLIAPVILASCGLGVILSELDNLFRYFFPPPKWATDLMRDLFQGEASTWGTVLALVIVAPVTEELLFRGLIFRGLMANHGFRQAALVSAALFALVHLNPWQFLTAFLLGLAFAWYVQKSGSILPGILGHALNNGLTILVAYLPFEIKGFNTADMPGSGGFQPWWLDLLGIALAAAGLWWFKKSSDRFQLVTPDIPPLLHPRA